MIQLEIAGITMGEVQTGAYALVVTKVGDRSHAIPIIIGTPEAQAIEMVLEELVSPRPQTHDLFVTLMNEVGAVLKQVEIYKHLDGIFYSHLVFILGEKTIRLDARTSDAIALAIRVKAPVFMEKSIFETLSVQPMTRENVRLYLTKEHRSMKDKSTVNKNATYLEFLPVEELQEQLQQAVSKEDYERAALLTKLIKKKK
ncbi:MAG: bifunctional nuclease family protein [Candidatus Symbiothrix sp.]|jgi:bifunctional DNase/RNase|nr:bifunctional nuclease family protein [Candidatus Symbiothrix sp.]